MVVGPSGSNNSRGTIITMVYSVSHEVMRLCATGVVGGYRQFVQNRGSCSSEETRHLPKRPLMYVFPMPCYL